VAGGKPEVVAAPAGSLLKAYIKTLIDRAGKAAHGAGRSRWKQCLKITGDRGARRALDMRLVGGFAETEYATKLGLAVSRIRKIWEGPRGREGLNLFSATSLRRAARRHIPEGSPSMTTCGTDRRTGRAGGGYRVHHDAETDVEKKLLFDDVNAGRVRILIGSTEKMGAGMNVQRRLAALHHLDAPWRPRDIEQREGRILRRAISTGGAHTPVCHGRVV